MCSFKNPEFSASTQRTQDINMVFKSGLFPRIIVAWLSWLYYTFKRKNLRFF